MSQMYLSYGLYLDPISSAHIALMFCPDLKHQKEQYEKLVTQEAKKQFLCDFVRDEPDLYCDAMYYLSDFLCFSRIDHMDAEIASIITDHTFPDLTESDTALFIPLIREVSFTEAAYAATEEMVEEVKGVLERFLGSPMPSYFSYEDHLCEIIGVYYET